MKRMSEKVFEQIKAMPIFSQIMRDANRAGRKSQTRRALKLPTWSTDDWKDYDPGDPGSSVFYPAQAYEPPLIIAKETGCLAEIKCPHGYPGEVRYMREPIFKGPGDCAYYLDDYTELNPGQSAVYHAVTGQPLKWQWKAVTLSGMYMPKAAARTFMKLDSLRIQALWDISESDCIAEGVVRENSTPLAIPGFCVPGLGVNIIDTTADRAYRRLWESINGADSWYENPLVWVIGYSKLADHGELISL